ncbi:hypothetical protein V6C27_00170 [Peptococcaceae bacterium 1198_IL3148]
MLNRKRNIVIFLTLAVIVVFMGIQTSLVNFNQDLGYQQPVKAFECYQTTEGLYISALNISTHVQKDQLASLLQPVTAAINNFPKEEIEQYQQIAIIKITTWWEQITNSNPLETVRCLTQDILDKVDSK